MRMIHGGEQLCLTGETGSRTVTPRGQNLDGHVAVQGTVSAGQHQPGRTRTECGAQVIAGERRPHRPFINNHDLEAPTRPHRVVTLANLPITADTVRESSGACTAWSQATTDRSSTAPGHPSTDVRPDPGTVG